MDRFLICLFYDFQKKEKEKYCFRMLSSCSCTLRYVEMTSLFISDYVLEGSEGTPYAGKRLKVDAFILFHGYLVDFLVGLY